MYTKKQIADALVKFIHNDLINDIDDKHSKFSLCMAKKALRENQDILDYFLESPVVSSVIKEQDGMYDIDVFAKTLKNVLNEYDSYSITIPKIPMFAPKDCVIKITSADVDKIISYLSNEPVSVA
ncbi:hypothetical protein SAMN04487977_101449 [Treponema bryantii]|uniref:Uncharacterized protein n=1 Tax=Treponema bryantii TaxID=163 RepID=A0A1H9ARX8_9SPIR|nr:hypothetical protein [Treponema bryantii]SEP79544.1 hypothetical protein SAMN04487977_101449 [Treponema bryantii]